MHEQTILKSSLVVTKVVQKEISEAIYVKGLNPKLNVKEKSIELELYN